MTTRAASTYPSAYPNKDACSNVAYNMKRCSTWEGKIFVENHGNQPSNHQANQEEELPQLTTGQRLALCDPSQEWTK